MYLDGDLHFTGQELTLEHYVCFGYWNYQNKYSKEYFNHITVRSVHAGQTVWALSLGSINGSCCGSKQLRATISTSARL